MLSNPLGKTLTISSRLIRPKIKAMTMFPGVTTMSAAIALCGLPGSVSDVAYSFDTIYNISSKKDMGVGQRGSITKIEKGKRR